LIKVYFIFILKKKEESNKIKTTSSKLSHEIYEEKSPQTKGRKKSISFFLFSFNKNNNTVAINKLKLSSKKDYEIHTQVK
jgi:hypothetical protein